MPSCCLMSENPKYRRSYRYNEELENDLHLAVKESRNDCVLAMVAGGLPIDCPNIYGETALHIAVRMDNYEVVDLLLTVGAELDVKSSSGETPLELAVTFDSKLALKTILQFLHEVQPFLLEELINKLYTGGMSLLHMATDLIVLAMLLEYGIDVNILSEKGVTPLHLTAARGNLIGTVLLAHAGATLDARNPEGKTPRSLAIEAGHDGVALFLDDFIKQNEFQFKWLRILYFMIEF